MSIWQDVRYSGRMLRKAPLFAGASVLVLALGIGATTTIFNVVDVAILRPLPFPEPDRLVMVSEAPPRARATRVAPLNFLDWSEQSRSFRSIAATAGVASGPLMDAANGAPEPVAVQSVSSGFFDVFDVRPIAGRTFAAGDAVQTANAAVLSEGLWKRRFGADPTLVGRTIRLGSGGNPFVVIGIVPASFQILGRADVWTLMRFARTPDQRRNRYLQVVARLKRGTTIQQARGDVAAISAGIANISPDTNQDWGVIIDPLGRAIVGDELLITSLVLAGVVAFVLLLACATVATLVLARAVGRTREVAVRAALGGSRIRIARQLLTENLMLSMSGGAVGLFVAWATLHAAPALIPARTIPESIVLAPNWRLTFVGLAVTLATTVMFGLIPAWHTAGAPLAEAISAGGRTATDRGGPLQSMLAVIEIASALLLTTGAGLLLRTLLSLDGVDAGYRADHVLTMSIGTSINRFRSQDELAAFYQRIEHEIAGVGGVRVASLTSDVPLDGWSYGQTFEAVGRPSPDPSHRPPAHYQIITPRYFEALGIQLLRGRVFSDDDSSTAPPVCIVNEEFVRRYLRDADPIGARISVRAMAMRPGGPIVREVIGVIRQVKTRPAELENALEIYVPLAQNPWFSSTIVVRTDGDPMPLMPAIKAAVARVEPTQLVVRPRTMEEVAAESTARPRFRAQLVAAFAGVAVVLALVGIFSVVMFSVQHRAREFAIRLALGGRASDILRLVIGDGLKLTFGGVVIGTIGAAALARFLSSLLFGVQPLDPLTFAAAPALLAIMSLTACMVPAIRAVRVDPAVTLRSL